MRKRIQHHRKQRPSRVQLVRIEPLDKPEAAAQLVAIEAREIRSFGANVDGRPLRWARGLIKGQRATFDTAKRAEREALFALACRHLDAGAWAGLRAKASAQAIDDLAFVDLLELGLIDDDGKLNAAGALVLERLGKPAVEPPPGPAAAISTGALIHQARAMAEHSTIDLDAPLIVHVKIKGESHALNVYSTKAAGSSLQLEVEVPA